MATDFDERQAFDDLRKILHHLHDIGGRYYDAWQTAEENLSALKILHEREVSDLREQLRTAQENFADKLTEQTKIFSESLQQQDNYNNKLAEQLKTLKRRLETQEDDLQARERNVAEREQELDRQRDKLNQDLKTFDEQKASLESELAGYKASQDKVDGFEEEKHRLRKKIAELEDLKTQNEETIKKLSDDNERLQRDLDDYTKRNREWDRRQSIYSPSYVKFQQVVTSDAARDDNSNA